MTGGPASSNGCRDGSHRTTRRRVLATAATLGTVPVAGCFGGSGDEPRQKLAVDFDTADARYIAAVVPSHTDLPPGPDTPYLDVRINEFADHPEPMYGRLEARDGKWTDEDSHGVGHFELVFEVPRLQPPRTLGFDLSLLDDAGVVHDCAPLTVHYVPPDHPLPAPGGER